MFDPWCPTCDARVLLTTRRLVSLAPTPTGHTVHLRCWCDTIVSMAVDRIDTPAAAPVRPPVVGDAPTVPGASPTAA